MSWVFWHYENEHGCGSSGSFEGLLLLMSGLITSRLFMSFLVDRDKRIKDKKMKDGWMEKWSYIGNWCKILFQCWQQKTWHLMLCGNDDRFCFYYFSEFIIWQFPVTNGTVKRKGTSKYEIGWLEEEVWHLLFCSWVMYGLEWEWLNRRGISYTWYV